MLQGPGPAHSWIICRRPAQPHPSQPHPTERVPLLDRHGPNHADIIDENAVRAAAAQENAATRTDNDVVENEESSDVTRQPADPPPSFRRLPATIDRFTHAERQKWLGGGIATRSDIHMDPAPRVRRHPTAPTHKVVATGNHRAFVDPRNHYPYTRLSLGISSEICSPIWTSRRQRHPPPGGNLPPPPPSRRRHSISQGRTRKAEALKKHLLLFIQSTLGRQKPWREAKPRRSVVAFFIPPRDHSTTASNACVFYRTCIDATQRLLC
jgi:hypothetical protein